ncbi:hypothetical protein QBC39DRAFT_385428 [Podospora conica]|nr:hypothetical protein QBC39DRAFT_385428 [Schizothecium conicum]
MASASASQTVQAPAQQTQEVTQQTQETETLRNGGGGSNTNTGAESADSFDSFWDKAYHPLGTSRVAVMKGRKRTHVTRTNEAWRDSLRGIFTDMVVHARKAMLVTLDKRHEDEYIKFLFKDFANDDTSRRIIAPAHKRYQWNMNTWKSRTMSKLKVYVTKCLDEHDYLSKTTEDKVIINFFWTAWTWPIFEENFGWTKGWLDLRGSNQEKSNVEVWCR